MADYSVLHEVMDFWSYWGFEPWEHDGMKGVFRKVTFVKDGLIGEVARYFAYDYIIWSHRGQIDADKVFSNWKPMKDTMTQRIIFIEDEPDEKRKIKSFFMGLKGYLEVYHYSVNGSFDKKFKDLAPLVDRAWALLDDPEYKRRKEAELLEKNSG